MSRQACLGLLWVVVILFFLISSKVRAQEILSEVDIVQTEQLDRFFKSYKLKKFHKDRHKKFEGEHRLLLEITDEALSELILTPSYLLAEDHKITTTAFENQEDIRQSLVTPYAGYIKGDPGSSVRLSLSEEYIYGYVKLQNRKYFIEPAQRFDKSLKKDVYIIYSEDQVHQGSPISCAATTSKKETKRTSVQLKAGATCQLADLAIAMDYAYHQEFGGSAGAINQTISVMNMVAGTYEDAFADDIRFEIVEHFVSTCSGCDPWTTSVDANTLLTDFTNWGPGGFSEEHDIGQFWTDRNICGPSDCSVAGLAWINAICGSFRYHILEDFTSTAWQLRVLVAHEIGHNFGATHDGFSSQHVMRPSIGVNTTSWSSQSISEVNSALLGFSCFEECVVGSCSEITNIFPTNCTPGNPGLYDLILEIRHGGGGTSSTFDVHVNGQIFNHSWSPSPQTVIISNLAADGTFNNLVSISADDGSDTGCSGSDTYDEPSGDCILNVVENFDNCTIPTGWASASTNGFIWNGGDPLLQYEWKFDDATRQIQNYGAAQNASSLKTLNGTCMALMDDDIISSSDYSGIVTLTSPIYDVSDFDTVKLRFDYNFHPFEDGGKGANNSYFHVEVFDGVSWNSILTDTDSSCPWNDVWPGSCATFSDIDISTLANSDMRFRFIYSDGDDGAWAGMIALDNINLYASVTLEDPACDPVVTITPASPPGLSIARDVVTTSGVITILSNSIWSASTSQVITEFEVSSGTTFEVNNDGCQ